MIHSLVVNGMMVSNQVAMVVASFDHIKSLLSVAKSYKFSMDLEFLGICFENLVDLDTPSRRRSSCCSNMSCDKAPGQHHGLLEEFLHACWVTMKSHIVVGLAPSSTPSLGLALSL